MKRTYKDISGLAAESQERAKKLSRQARSRINKKREQNAVLSTSLGLETQEIYTNDIIFDSNQVFIIFKLLLSLSYLFFLSDKTTIRAICYGYTLLSKKLLLCN